MESTGIGAGALLSYRIGKMRTTSWSNSQILAARSCHHGPIPPERHAAGPDAPDRSKAVPKTGKPGKLPGSERPRKTALPGVDWRSFHKSYKRHIICFVMQTSDPGFCAGIFKTT
jgi:hypothetical protein